MSNQYGVLMLNPDANALIASLNIKEVWDTANAYIAQYNAEMVAASAALVERTEVQPKTRYYLAGGGQMQRSGGYAQAHALKPYGYWDVAFPIEEFRDQIAGTRNTFSKMTLQKLQAALNTITARNNNTRKFEMLKALFTDTARTFGDDEYGDLTIQPLANADSVLYPPLQGTTTETTLDSYEETNYLATAIDDTNNPIAYVAAKLIARFGSGPNKVAFFHLDEKAEVEDLTDFEPVIDPKISPGANTDRVTSAPADCPGEIIGRCNGMWVSIWADIPSGYMFAMDLDEPRPLIERVPETGSGIPRGLHVVVDGGDSGNYPWLQTHYEDHFGYGVGNRLNGYVLEFATGGTYTVPTIYQ